MQKPLKEELKRIALSIFGVLLGFGLMQRSIAETNVADESTHEAKLIVIPRTNYKPAGESEQSERGKILFDRLNCMACHSIHNAGGDLAPMLDGIGGRRSDQFLTTHLSDSPEDVEIFQTITGLKASKLLHSRYSQDTAGKLVAYLKSLPEPPGGFVVTPHATHLPADIPAPADPTFKPESDSAEAHEGAKSFERFGCVACHSIGNVGGWLGPRLDGIGARRNRAFIYQHVTGGQASAHSDELERTETSPMPSYRLEPQQAKEIVEFLLTVPDLKSVSKSKSQQ